MEVIPLKKLIGWQIDRESLQLVVAPSGFEKMNRNIVIKTDSASIFNEMLRCLSTLKVVQKEEEVPSFKKK